MKLLAREQREPDVDRRGILGSIPTGRGPGASLSWPSASVQQQHVAPTAGSKVIRDTGSHHPGTYDDYRRRLHAVKTCSGCLKLLNSKALPLGSRRNIVACSPGWPGYRIRGSRTKLTPAARIRPATD